MSAIAKKVSVIVLLSAAFGALAVHTGVVNNVKSPVPATLSSAASTEALKIGAVMPKGHEHAGWIYGGISNTTGRPFYVAPKDSGALLWQEAMDFAARSHASLPSSGELDQIYQARDEGALKGTFNTTAFNTTGGVLTALYWSSAQKEKGGVYSAYAQHFGDGGQGWGTKLFRCSVRLVRG
jgi:hypothetical protein